MALTNPGNTVRIKSRLGGRGSVYEEHMWAQTWSSGLFSGNGVTQNTSADMNVIVGGNSSTKPDVVIGQNPSGYNIALDLVSKQTIAITKPASNSRITSIVAYTNDLSVASTDTTTSGNQSSCGLIVVNGATAASPVAPSDSDIRSAITADGATGSQASYCVIANITVASTTTTITNSLITNTKSTLTSDKLDLATKPYFLANKTTDQTITAASTFTKLTFNSLVRNTTNGTWASSTFTVVTPGLYNLRAKVVWGTGDQIGRGFCSIYVNGTEAMRGTNSTTMGDANASMADITQVLAKNDTVEVYVWHANANKPVSASTQKTTQLSIELNG